MIPITFLLAPNYGPALYNGARLANNFYKNTSPEDKADFVDFLLALVIYAMIAAIIGAIGAGVAKFVFETDKEQTQATFVGVGAITLIICVICYFI